MAIETSCDETAAAVIQDGKTIKSNIVASQIEIHRRYGGVFPEVASRQHILAISTVIQDALIKARTGWNELSAVAVTYGPGLVGSLLVGVNTAKGLALSLGIPLIGINHLEGHLYSNWLHTERDDSKPDIKFPNLCLIVSGGHTELVLMHDHGNYEILGQTIDDAAGEAFDKVARMMNLGFPGGPAIQEVAKEGNPQAHNFPRARLGNSLDFSFSGLKTAVLRVVQKHGKSSAKILQHPAAAAQAKPKLNIPVADIAASFQMAVVDVLVRKTKIAADKYNVTEILIAGGVSANALLRNKLMAVAGRPVRSPAIHLCTDNAAMIGAAAYWHYRVDHFSDWDLDVVPNLKLV
ncbi:tRNA (adenosine(37)-N6)-threonylcarbamoyltransferase complex transferase subunit TsaD [Anaerolineales bacterium HSG24]|nr:tRNA (adenosine(37)-N6)-threonylcarbamoyltransferase complex transferase subunit TsaD [Anaerolineales bacterium HSG24]